MAIRERAHATGAGPHHVTIDSAIVVALGALADTAQIEHFRCLLGAVQHDTLYVSLAYEPRILHADDNGVAPAPCPLGTIGTWHNHTPWISPIWDPSPQHRHPMEPKSMCYLSRIDVESTLQLPVLLAMVSVDQHTHCAWLKVIGRNGQPTLTELGFLK